MSLGFMGVLSAAEPAQGLSRQLWVCGEAAAP